MAVVDLAVRQLYGDFGKEPTKLSDINIKGTDVKGLCIFTSQTFKASATITIAMYTGDDE